MEISKRYPEHQIDDVIYDGDSCYVHMSAVSDASECLYCGSENIVKFGSRVLKTQDMPEKGKPVTLVLKQPRYRCNDCNKTFVMTPEHKDIDHKVTKKLADYVVTQSLTRSFIDISDEVGIHPNTARDIFLSYYQQKIDELNFNTPTYLGLERASVVKPATLITNVSECRVLDMVAGQEMSDVETYLLEHLDMNEVSYVYMGMWQPYKELVVKLAPKATIVINRWHAFNLVQTAVERVRVAVRSPLDTIARRLLSEDKNILAKRRYELTNNDKQTLQKWCDSYPEIYQAYELKEHFYTIWDCTTGQDARAAYSEWQDSITPAVKAYFTPLIALIDTWSNEVFAYFDNPKFNDHSAIVLDLETTASELSRRRSFAAVKAALLFNKEKDQYGIKVADLVK